VSKGPTNKMHLKSFIVLIVLVFVFFGAAAGNLARELLVNGKEYQKEAIDQQLRDSMISPKRGTIYDRNMKPLAQSDAAWDVVVKPNEIKEKEGQQALIADTLAGVLGIDRDEIFRQAGADNNHRTLKKRVDKSLKEKVSALIVEKKLAGVYLEENNKRYYTYPNFASHILGFTSDEVLAIGQDGLESYYEKYLKGEPGRVVAAKNARGADMPFNFEQMHEPKNGNNLVLTIDEVAQHFLEKNLERGITEHKVMNKGMGIIMDVQTGEILALSVKPDYDSNAPRVIADEILRAQIDAMPEGDDKKKALGEAQAAQWRNKAISDTYEPGSVFKTFTMAAGLEEGLINKGETYYCSGTHIVLGEKMKCHNTSGHGTQTLTEAVVNSCNPAFMMIGEKLGAANFFKYFKAFGFTQKTGIDLPGEATGIFVPENKLRPVELASCSFGQSNSMTAIQMITAMAASCNGGKLLTPRIVKQVVDNEGNIIESFTPQVKRQVISAETSKTIRSILEKVVATGSGRNAYLVGYQIAGKTGTSQKLNQKEGEEKEYVASFCCFAPAEDPRIACMIIFDTPRGKSYYGSGVAAPIARDIMADLLPYLSIDPRYTEADLAKMDVNTPNVESRSVKDAKGILDKAGLKVTVVGDGENIVKQIPSVGKPIPKNGTVVLYTDSQTSMVTVPNFIGKSPSEVSQLAASHKLNVRLAGALGGTGQAKASRQSAEQDIKVEAGTVIVVDFAYVDSVE